MSEEVGRVGRGKGKEEVRKEGRRNGKVNFRRGWGISRWEAEGDREKEGWERER